VCENIHARRLLGEAGIRVGFFLQLGYLGEGIEDILATRRLVEEARPDDVGVSVSYPLPGTKFYEAVKQQLGEKRHWQESNDLDMMFAGTYRSEFYRAVRNLLHDQVENPGAHDIEQRWARLVENETAFRQPPFDRGTFKTPLAEAAS
jgi:anaerobic magnesium-protoporphyrin IX monomethyl ester cyclase